jgi:hypothetical protein
MWLAWVWLAWESPISIPLDHRSSFTARAPVTTTIALPLPVNAGFFAKLTRHSPDFGSCRTHS